MKNSHINILATYFWTGFGIYLGFWGHDFHGALLCFVMSGVESLKANNNERKEAEAASTEA
jgi:hypothetical protein